jgi:hypothetical protein
VFSTEIVKKKSSKTIQVNYPSYYSSDKLGDESWTSKGPGSAYDERNISVVILRPIRFDATDVLQFTITIALSSIPINDSFPIWFSSEYMLSDGHTILYTGNVIIYLLSRNVCYILNIT